MNKIFKKLTALILSVVMIFGITAFSASAAFDPAASVQSFISTVLDFFKDLFGISDEEISDVVILHSEKGDVVPKGAKTKSTHASTVVKTADGKLMSAWFGGKGEGEDDVRIWFAVYEDGKWSEASQVPSNDTVAHWNPVLQNFGSYVRLYYKVGAEIPNWVTKYTDTYDSGKTWTAPKELVEGDTSGGRGPVRSKCLITSNGTIIAPSSSEQGDWKAFFDISADGGNTWQRTDFVESDAQMIQPTLWESDDGNIHALFRTKSGKIYRSDSTDGGYTWCKAYKTNLPNNNSGIDLVKSDNGYLWLCYNPITIEGLRYELILSVSKDGGETWQKVETLEKSSLIFKEYSYPSIIADGNKLVITYTYEREKICYEIIEFK